MNKIEEMLKNEKVEWRKLGELIDYEQPTKYIVNETDYSNEYEIPVLTAGQTFILGYTNEKENTYKASNEFPVIIFDDFTTSNHWVDFEFKIKSSAMKILKPKNSLITFRYCYYFIKTLNIDITDHKRMWISKISNIEIPIPSIKTQEKIVKILDSYTKYITELQEKLKIELQSRNKQYNYYRDMLLSEDYLNKISNKIFIQSNNVIHKTKLIEIAKLRRGKRLIRRELHENGQYPVFQNSLTPLGYYNNKNFDGGKTCIVTAGAAGEIFYQDRDFWAADDVLVITTDDILNKYLYYFLLNKQNLIKSKVRKASVPRLSRDDIEKIEVLLPPIEIQNKIVKILDRFQELLSETKGLLPLEIEQRRKQYEYYREKLLTFDSKCGCLPACLPYNKY